MAGIKETMDLVNLLDVTADVYAAAKADGSIDYKDLVKLGPEIAALRAAVDGANLIAEELKDLDKEELSALCPVLLAAIFKLVKSIL